MKKPSVYTYLIPLTILPIIIGFALISANRSNRFDSRSKAASESYSPFWGYDTHPNFWQVGSDRWTAKKYTRLPSTPNPGFDVMWVWSGPHSSGGRYVIYQKYPGDNPGAYHEWELWTGNQTAHSAVVQKYGGPQEASSYPVSSGSDCDSGSGISWPNLSSGDSVKTVPNSVKISGSCRTGGHIGIRMYQLWDKPNSTIRNGLCATYIPQSVTPVGNRICREAPNAGIVYQNYVFGSPPGVNPSQYQHGCEATVYAWGYPQNSADNYRTWFRNGELRWSEYLNLGTFSTVKDSITEKTWWDTQCKQAFTQKPNYLYTGTYKLTNTIYTDN